MEEDKHINEYHYNRAQEVKTFDETKSGVKGLIDSGLTKIPKMFIHDTTPESHLPDRALSPPNPNPLHIPIIDLRDPDPSELREAAEKWGFFQMLNHGLDVSLLQEMLESIKSFHEQASEMKMEWYSRDHHVPVRYYCNGDLYISKAANWRDSIAFSFHGGKVDPQLMPSMCRSVVCPYMEEMMKLKKLLSELLSEALGLSRDRLGAMQCMETETLVCHYYPRCPEPDLTIGAAKHADPSFLTVLLQDGAGGLQVLRRERWLDVPFVPGGLIVNIGDLMQLITNDKFKSVEHRVQVRQIGPRVSAACFFYPSKSKTFGPMKEFVSDDNPPKYREIRINEYLEHYKSKGLDGNSALTYFELQ